MGLGTHGSVQHTRHAEGTCGNRLNKQTRLIEGGATSSTTRGAYASSVVSSARAVYAERSRAGGHTVLVPLELAKNYEILYLLYEKRE